MVAGRVALVVSGVELAYDASFAIRYVRDEGAQISFSGENIDSLVAQVVDTKLDRLDTDIIPSEGNEAGVPSDGKVCSVAVFADHVAALAFAV